MDRSVPQYLRDHARLLAGDIKALSDTAIRQESPDALRLLSLIATEGRLDFPELVDEMRAVVAADDEQAASDVRLREVARLARTAIGLARSPEALAEAADLYQAVRILRRRGTDKPLPGNLDAMDAQVNLALGRIDYVDRHLADLDLTDDQRWVIETDLMNPLTGRPGSTYDAWVPQLNRILARHGLAPLGLTADEPALFDRLTAGPSGTEEAGPLVTIVMSVFEPDRNLLTALRSLAAQTWTNLQVLVMDDCSPPRFQPLIDEAVALDDRFELHRMPRNGGTYAIRNAALGLARGDFIGFQDSDDWSHPARIERQLRPLLDDDRLVASLSGCVMVDPELRVNIIGYGPVRTNSSSLLLRRVPVVETMGGFDRVRKGADSEFISRLRIAFGAERLLELDEPLAIVQLRTGSLSQGEFSFGRRDGDRVAYRDAFEFWHAGIARGEIPARLDPDGVRPFPAPDAFLGRQVSDRPCDVLLVSDWRAGIPRYAGAADEARALARSGIATVLVHTEGMRFASRQEIPPSPAILRARASGWVSVVRWADPLRAKVAVVNDPELLSYPRPADAVGLRADRVVVYAAFPPQSPRQDAIVYDPAVVEANAKALFGGEVVWQPASADVAAALVADGASAEVLSPALLGVVPPRPRHRGQRGSRLVIGTTGLDTRLPDRPGWRGLLGRLPDDDRYDVRVRDTAGALQSIRKPREIPLNWLVTRSGSLDSFLRQLDVYVDYPRRAWGPEPSAILLAAMARGCVVVLDRSYEPVFGAAARYLDESVHLVLDALRDDRERFSSQQQRGLDFVAAELSPETYVARIGSLISTTPEMKERV